MKEDWIEDPELEERPRSSAGSRRRFKRKVRVLLLWLASLAAIGGIVYAAAQFLQSAASGSGVKVPVPVYRQ